MGKAAFMDKYIVCPYFRRIETNQICAILVTALSTSWKISLSRRMTKESKASFGR